MIPPKHVPVSRAITGDECADPTTPLGALSEFYRAFNHRDLALMRQNWHPDECVLDNPLGGIRRGWDEIEALYVRIELALRTSRVYRRMDGRWRQIHHHGSIEDPALLARYQLAVADD